MNLYESIKVNKEDKKLKEVKNNEKAYIKNCDNPDAFIAITKSVRYFSWDSDNVEKMFEKSKEIFESGKYVFFPGVKTKEDLGRAYADRVGGPDKVFHYDDYLDEYSDGEDLSDFDYKALGRDLIYDGYYITRTGAVQIYQDGIFR